MGSNTMKVAMVCRSVAHIARQSEMLLLLWHADFHEDHLVVFLGSAEATCFRSQRSTKKYSSNSISRRPRLNEHFVPKPIGPRLVIPGSMTLLKITGRRSSTFSSLLGTLQFLSTWIAAVIGRLRGKRILMWTHPEFVGRTIVFAGFSRRSILSLAAFVLYGMGAIFSWHRRLRPGKPVCVANFA